MNILQPQWLVFSLLFIIELGLIIMLIRRVITSYREYQWVRENGDLVKGRVIHHISRQDHDDYTQYAEVVEYAAADGRMYTITSDHFRMKRSEVHKEVDILYRTDDPSYALIDPFGTITSRSLILFFMTLGMVLFDLFLFNRSIFF